MPVCVCDRPNPPPPLALIDPIPPTTYIRTYALLQASNVLYKKRIYFTDANVPEALKCVF